MRLTEGCLSRKRGGPRSGDAGRYADVIARSNEASTFADLVKFLLMVRKKVKDPQVGASPLLLPLPPGQSACMPREAEEPAGGQCISIGWVFAHVINP